MNYELLVRPGLLAAAVLAAAVVLLLGRRKTTVDKFGVEVQKTTIAPLAKRNAAILLVGGLVVAATLVVVPAGHRGVVYSAAGGVNVSERQEGFSFVLPFAQNVVPVSIRTQKFFTDKAFAQSADLQEITVHVSVNYHIAPDKAAELYQSVGLNYAETVVSPAILQLVKERVGLIKAADFASRRAALAGEIRDALTDQLAGYGLVVEFVNIEDAVFDPAFIQSVKEKVIADEEAAEQRRLIEAEAAKRDQAILQAEGRAQSILIEARAQAEANSLVSETLTIDLITWQQILKWDGILPTTLVSDSAQLNMLMGIR